MSSKRQSSRLTKKLPASAAAISEDESGAPDSEFDDNEAAGTVNSRKRKAPGKSSKGSPTKQRPAKKFRGMRGMLRNVVEMPLDVVYEIFRNLLPIDLWNLARTSKDLRSILMSRSSAFIWRDARRNDPHDIPECPSHISEPEYAALCYAKHCTTCLRWTGSPYYLWEGRERICRKCINIPERPNGRNISSKKAAACQKWLDRHNRGLLEKKRSMIVRQREEVLKYAKGLGWPEELLRSDETIRAIDSCSKITKMLSKKLTEQALAGIKETLNVLLEAEQTKILQSKRILLLQQCLPILQKARNFCAKKLSPALPILSTSSLFSVPAVRSLIVDTPSEKEVTEEDMLLLIADNFSVYVDKWQAQQEQALLKLIETACGSEYITGKENIFDLATSFFQCSNCATEIIRAPRAMVHRCETTNSSWDGIDDITDSFEEDEIVDAILHEAPWNASNVISFHKDISNMIAEVIKLCGFDPETTTTAEMDATDPILECLSCHSVHTGRMTMSWSDVPYHRRHNHYWPDNEPMKLVVLEMDGPDTKFVQTQLAHMREKALAQIGTKDCFCTRCHLEGNTPDLKQHWKASHNEVAGADSISTLLDIRHYSHQYRLWPPRDLDNLASAVGTIITQLQHW